MTRSDIIVASSNGQRVLAREQTDCGKLAVNTSIACSKAVFMVAPITLGFSIFAADGWTRSWHRAFPKAPSGVTELLCRLPKRAFEIPRTVKPSRSNSLERTRTPMSLRYSDLAMHEGLGLLIYRVLRLIDELFPAALAPS